MNKRKKLIRTITEKTGVSHAGAANLLDRGKPKFVRKPFKIESLFLREEISEDSIPIYPKSLDERAFVISDEGDSILSIEKPRRVIVPVFRVNQKDQDESIRERMWTLFDCPMCFEDPPKPILTQEEVEPFFLKRFAGCQGRIFMFTTNPRGDLKETVEPGVGFGPDGNATVIAVHETAGRFVVKPGNLYGILLFESQVACVRVHRP